MSPFVAELLGTAILVLLGNGVVANVLLTRSKGQNSGWLVITTGWGLALAVAVYLTGHVSGAHLNPAVTLGLAAIGRFDWAQVPSYVVAQFIGAFLGALLVYLAYLPHWALTDDPQRKLAAFATGPEVRSPGANLLTEIIGTAMLVMGILGIGHPGNQLAGGLAPLLVGLLLWGIGLSLGGPTGFAVNPARDLGPRIAHAVLPIPGKGSSDWGYAWIPVVGPVIGGLLGAVLFRALFG